MVSAFRDGPRKLPCLRCEKPFVTASKENRICTECRGETESLMLGALPAAGLVSPSRSYHSAYMSD